LYNPVFIAAKKFEQFIKTILFITDPLHDLISLGPGMLSQYGVFQIHGLNVVKTALYFSYNLHYVKWRTVGRKYKNGSAAVDIWTPAIFGYIRGLNRFL
jgi:hypothetical protein